MNCELCKQELEAYREGRLPGGINTQVKIHLETCRECFEIYQLEMLANRVMKQEKEIQSNPFLSTRVMASIESMKKKQNLSIYQRILRPTVVSISIAAAILIGIWVGNIYGSARYTNEIPVELSYIDDSTLESINLLANE